ncbi:MAG: transporter [Desulfobaccales bacterium]
MNRNRLLDYGIKGKVLICLGLLIFLGGLGGLAAAPALAQTAAPEVAAGTPAGTPPPEEKKETAPSTAGPILTDYTIPIDTGHFSLSVLSALSFYPGTFNQNWKTVSAGGNFYTYFMPVKLTYGPMKNMEVYVVAPFIDYWGNDATTPGPNGNRSASYAGIGDLTLMGKYLLVEEGDIMPAVSAVAGFGTIPTGHASHLNPNLLGVDAIGSGALTFTTGVNMFKWVKPFLLYSNIWINSPVNIYQNNFENVVSRENVAFNLAAELPLTPKFVALLEMYSTWTWSNIYTIQGYQTPETYIGILPGLEYLATDKLSFEAGSSIDLAGKNGVKKYTPMISASYAF